MSHSIDMPLLKRNAFAESVLIEYAAVLNHTAWRVRYRCSYTADVCRSSGLLLGLLLRMHMRQHSLLDIDACQANESCVVAVADIESASVVISCHA
jgi:hypothetical protein